MTDTASEHVPWTLYYKANSAFHPSGVGKWVPASAGKAKAGMVHSVSGWTRGVQVKLRSIENACMPYLSALEVWSRQGAIQIHVYLYLYLYTYTPKRCACVLQTACGNFPKFTIFGAHGDKTELVSFWGQTVKGQAHGEINY